MQKATWLTMIVVLERVMPSWVKSSRAATAVAVSGETSRNITTELVAAAA